MNLPSEHINRNRKKDDAEPFCIKELILTELKLFSLSVCHSFFKKKKSKK
jgi:hypothetical protein